jgi:hypothetical protein
MKNIKNYKQFNESSVDVESELLELESYEPNFEYVDKIFEDNYMSDDDFQVNIMFKLSDTDYKLFEQDLVNNYDKYHNHFEKFIIEKGLDKIGQNVGILTIPEENTVSFSFENFDFRR